MPQPIIPLLSHQVLLFASIDKGVILSDTVRHPILLFQTKHHNPKSVSFRMQVPFIDDLGVVGLHTPHNLVLQVFVCVARARVCVRVFVFACECVFASVSVCVMCTRLCRRSRRQQEACPALCAKRCGTMQVMMMMTLLLVLLIMMTMTMTMTMELSGVDMSDDKTRVALMEFSFNLTIGNLDDSYKATPIMQHPHHNTTRNILPPPPPSLPGD